MTPSIKQTVLTDPLFAAIRLLTEEADSLRECHTRTPDDWTGEPEAKAAYDHILEVVALLSKLRAPVADTELRIEFTAGGVAYVSIEKARAAIEAARLASAPVANSPQIPTLRALIEGAIKEGDPQSTAQEIIEAIDGELGIYEDVYEQIVELIRPYVNTGKLPGSVVHSVEMLLEHWASAPVAGEAAYYAVMHGQALYGIFDSEAAAVVIAKARGAQ